MSQLMTTVWPISICYRGLAPLQTANGHFVRVRESSLLSDRYSTALCGNLLRRATSAMKIAAAMAADHAITLAVRDIPLLSDAFRLSRNRRTALSTAAGANGTKRATAAAG